MRRIHVLGFLLGLMSVSCYAQGSEWTSLDTVVVSQEAVWKVKRGDSLKKTLSAWTNKAGFNAIEWNVQSFDPEMIQMGSNAEFEGTLKDALGKFLASLALETKLAGHIYKGNKVIVITE